MVSDEQAKAWLSAATAAIHRCAARIRHIGQTVRAPSMAAEVNAAHVALDADLLAASVPEEVRATIVQNFREQLAREPEQDAGSSSFLHHFDIAALMEAVERARRRLTQ